jgi:2-dehydropantoate 2-reductase
VSFSSARLLVAGTGAIGGITAAYLKRAGFDVTAVDPWYQNVEAIRRGGLAVKSPDEDFNVPLPALHLDDLALSAEAAFDLAFLAVKSYDTEWMLRAIVPFLKADAPVVSTQNGINEDRIASIIGRDRTIGCVVHMNGGMFEPGVVTRYASPAWHTFTIGELDASVTPRIEELEEAMSSVGRTDATSNIRGQLWSKLTLNAMSNGLSGLTGFTSRRLWTDPRAVTLMTHVGGEAVLASQALGVEMEAVQPTGAPRPLPAELLKRAHLGDAPAMAEVLDTWREAGLARSGGRENRPSLLQDVTKGRRTEIDYLNGYIVQQGAAVGVATPANESIVTRVKALERGELQQGEANLDALAL